MMGFKAFHSAQATIAGIETAHMIRKGQLSEDNIPAYKQFNLAYLDHSGKSSQD
jgi:putative transposase